MKFESGAGLSYVVYENIDVTHEANALKKNANIVASGSLVYIYICVAWLVICSSSSSSSSWLICRITKKMLIRFASNFHTIFIFQKAQRGLQMG